MLVWAGLLFASSAAAQTSFTVTPQEFSFALSARSATTATASLAIAALNGNGPYSAAVRYTGPDVGWLLVSPAAGTTPAILSVTADASRLSAGTYNAQITITLSTPGQAVLGRAINVTLTVGGTPGTTGSLLVNPTSLTFIGGTQGEAFAPPQSLTVTAPAGATASITFRAVASSGWISVPPLTMTTPFDVPVVAYQSGLPAGTYTGAISLIPTAGGPATIVPVTLKAAGITTAVNELKLGQTAVNVNYQLGTPLPAARAVSITTSPIGVVGVRDYTATTSTSWIKLTGALTFVPAQTIQDLTFGNLNVIVDPTGLPPGTYIGNVVVTSSGLPTVNLPVTLRVSTTQELNAQPSSLVLDDLFDTQAVVEVTSTASAGLTFTAVASSANGWLRVTPTSGTTAGGSAFLTVSTNPVGLSGGVYNGSVTLTASNGATLSIPVRLNVTFSTANLSVLFVNPESIALTGTLGKSNPSQILQVGADTGSAHSYTVAASSTEGWLAVDATSGTAPGRITVSANLAALTRPGTYTGTVIVTSLLTGGVLNVPVTLEVDEEGLKSSADTLTFTQPGRFAPFQPQSIQLTSNIPNAPFRFLDVPAWLRVSDLSGTTPMTVSLWPELSLLPPGSNPAATIRIQGARNTLSLSIRIAFADPPTLAAVPETVALTYALGGPLPSQTVGLNTGTEKNPFSLKVSTESGKNWLLVTPVSGTTPADIRVTIDPALVTTGRLAGSIAVTLDNGSGQTKVIPVTLAVNPPAAVIESVLHSATQAPSAVAPGQIITITGMGFGGVTGITARPTAAGAYETRLAETRVLFDGVPAPILFLRSDQINAIVPYTLSGRVNTRLQIEQQGNMWSLPVDLRVADALPGLFTTGGTGRGQASAANGDFSPNSILNPAERGSVISLFGTGEGQTDPPGQDGRIISSDLRRPVLPVTALIGGRPAEVLFAGSASGLVSGVFQVNLRVPADVTTGVVPVQIQIGNAISAAGVTIVVK